LSNPLVNPFKSTFEFRCQKWLILKFFSEHLNTFVHEFIRYASQFHSSAEFGQNIHVAMSPKWETVHKWVKVVFVAKIVQSKSVSNMAVFRKFKDVLLAPTVSAVRQLL